MQTIQRRKSSTYYGISRDVMNHYVFVSNLASNVKEEHVLQVFNKFKPTSARIVPMKMGIVAFVCFATPEQVAKVLEEGAVLNFRVFFRKLIVQPLYSRGSLHTLCPHIEPPHFIRTPLELHPSIIRVVKKRKSVPLLRECIAVIASYLEYRDRANMEMVSRVWRLGSIDSHCKTVFDPNDKLWGKRKDEPVKVTNNMFEWLLKRSGHKLVTINLGDQANIKCLTPEVMEMIVQYCPKVANLHVDGIKLRPGAVLQIAMIGNRLRSLSVGPWDDVTDTVQDTNLAILLRKSRHLESLKVTIEPVNKMNSMFHDADKFGKYLLDITPTLRHLEISNCEKIDKILLGRAIKRFRRLESLKIEKCCSNTAILSALFENNTLHSTLTRLEFNKCYFVPYSRSVGLGTTVLQCCKNVTTLQLRSCDWVTTETIEQIGAQMAQLEHLDISECDAICGKFALDPLANLTHLKSLKMSDLCYTVEGQFLKSLPNLRSLDCKDSTGVTDKNICDLLWNAHFLEYVNVQGCMQISKRVVSTLCGLWKNSPRKIPLEIDFYNMELTGRVKWIPNFASITRIQ